MPPLIENDKEQLLDEILAGYLHSTAKAQMSSRDELIAGNPDLAAELQDFFENQDRFQIVTEPLRLAVCANSGHPAGSAIGDYEVLEELGRGGMGVVYKVRQKQLGRIAALKMLRVDPLSSQADIQRFRLEMEATSHLEHSHIVPIYEVGGQDGCPYFCMKWMPGGSLASRMTDFTAAKGSQTQAQIAELMITIARAVHHAHTRGILHRDLKPANILLDEDDKPYVSDFGLAKRFSSDDEKEETHVATSRLTQSGAVVGTPSYMPPEQAAGQQRAITIASDVYGLGAVLYELLSGKPPFSGETPLDVLQQIAAHDPAAVRSLNAGIDRDLETICHKCLRKDPAGRYQTAAALADDLERFVKGEPIHARPVATVERVWRWCRRNPALSAVSALAAAALILVTAGGTWFGVRESLHTVTLKKAFVDTQKALARAEKNENEAQRQQVLAEARSRDAHDAVYNFSLHVEEELGKHPHLLSLRKKLLESALPYYQKFLREQAANPALRLELAQAHEQVSVIMHLMGSKSKALVHREKAAALYQQLQQTNPKGADLQHRLMKSLLDVAAQLQSLDRHEESLQARKEALRQGEQFAQLNPKDSRFANLLRRGAENTAVLYHQMGRQAQAIPIYEKVIADLQKLVADNPKRLNYQGELALCCNNLGVAQAVTGKRREALRSFEQARDLREKMVEANPRNTDWQLALAASYRDIGSIQRELGNADAGLSAWEKALEIRERLARAHPNLARYQSDLAGSYQDMGKAHRFRKQYDSAAEHYRKARVIWEKLIETDPESADYQNKLARCVYDLGRIYGFQRRWDDARVHFQQASDVMQKLVTQHPKNLVFHSDLAKSLHGFSVAWQLEKEREKALPLVRRAIHHQKIAFDGAPQITKYRLQLNAQMRTLQQLQVDTGKIDEGLRTVMTRQVLCGKNPSLLYALARDVAYTPALSDLDVEQKNQWNDLAMEILNQAVTVGFRDEKKMQEENAFKLLRRRDDFQKLLSKLPK